MQSYIEEKINKINNKLYNLEGWIGVGKDLYLFMTSHPSTWQSHLTFNKLYCYKYYENNLFNNPVIGLFYIPSSTSEVIIFSMDWTGKLKQQKIYPSINSFIEEFSKFKMYIKKFQTVSDLNLKLGKYKILGFREVLALKESFRNNNLEGNFIIRTFTDPAKVAFLDTEYNNSKNISIIENFFACLKIQLYHIEYVMLREVDY